MIQTTANESLHRECSQHFLRRSGVTLIELLIVVGLLTLLATISLTSVKGLLKDQKVSSASRLVQQYLETAKVRAITTGRPVAVFLDRVGMDSDATGGRLISNYTASRLSLGEVKPPYTGDIVGATGVLWDVNMTVSQNTNSPRSNSRPADGYADQVRFYIDDVVSGFGTQTFPGFIQPGDLIEFDGSNRQFQILDIRFVPAANRNLPEVAVTFFNPPLPSLCNQLLQTNGFDPLCPTYSTEPPDLPASSLVVANGNKVPRALDGVDDETPYDENVFLKRTKFRIYRRPVRSLVGSITMPRGTCIDLFMSGLGSDGTANAIDRNQDSAAIGNAFFKPPPPNNFQGVVLSPDSYSRVGILFDRTGKPMGLFLDEKYSALNNPGLATERLFQSFALDRKLYLLVGRTDQVISGLNELVKPAPQDKEAVLPNLFDTSNSWISINQNSGLVDTNPLASVPNAVATNGTVSEIIGQARALANVGVNNGGQ